ncbi:hypothetical protein GJ496_004910 [Pomphorhynchus laevis]|nr:hypothetical protein GJ496_004910 [Pomphorhynchus laevis]
MEGTGISINIYNPMNNNTNDDSGTGVDNRQDLTDVTSNIIVDRLRDMDRNDLVKIVIKQKTFIEQFQSKLNTDRNQYKLHVNHLLNNQKDIMYKHKVKELRMQAVMAQFKQFKENHAPLFTRLRHSLLDPSLNRIFEKMKIQIDECRSAKEEALNDLQAWTFTTESQIGKRLVARCKKLLQENEEFGKLVTSGNVAKLNAEINMQRQYIQELHNQEQDYDMVLVDMDDELDLLTSICKALEKKANSSFHSSKKTLSADNKQQHSSCSSYASITTTSLGSGSSNSRDDRQRLFPLSGRRKVLIQDDATTTAASYSHTSSSTHHSRLTSLSTASKSPMKDDRKPITTPPLSPTLPSKYGVNEGHDNVRMDTLLLSSSHAEIIPTTDTTAVDNEITVKPLPSIDLRSAPMEELSTSITVASVSDSSRIDGIHNFNRRKEILSDSYYYCNSSSGGSSSNDNAADCSQIQQLPVTDIFEAKKDPSSDGHISLSLSNAEYSTMQQDQKNQRSGISTKKTSSTLLMSIGSGSSASSGGPASIITETSIESRDVNSSLSLNSGSSGDGGSANLLVADSSPQLPTATNIDKILNNNDVLLPLQSNMSMIDMRTVCNAIFDDGIDNMIDNNNSVVIASDESNEAKEKAASSVTFDVVAQYNISSTKRSTNNATTSSSSFDADNAKDFVAASNQNQQNMPHILRSTVDERQHQQIKSYSKTSTTSNDSSSGNYSQQRHYRPVVFRQHQLKHTTTTSSENSTRPVCLVVATSKQKRKSNASNYSSDGEQLTPPRKTQTKNHNYPHPHQQHFSSSNKTIKSASLSSTKSSQFSLSNKASSNKFIASSKSRSSPPPKSLQVKLSTKSSSKNSTSSIIEPQPPYHKATSSNNATSRQKSSDEQQCYHQRQQQPYSVTGIESTNHVSSSGIDRNHNRHKSLHYRSRLKSAAMASAASEDQRDHYQHRQNQQRSAVSSKSPIRRITASSSSSNNSRSIRNNSSSINSEIRSKSRKLDCSPPVNNHEHRRLRYSSSTTATTARTAIGTVTVPTSSSTTAKPHSYR